GPDSHRAEPDVDVAERHHEETQPGPAMVGPVEAAGATVGHREALPLRELIPEPAGEVPHRVAAEGVAAEADHVGGEDQAADPDAERGPTGAVRKPERLPRVVAEHEEEEDGEEQEVAVDVLEDQWEVAFAEILLPRLAHGAGGRIRPE